ncbi:MAG: Cytochrome oxidase, cbb3-type, subunit [Pseudomonadota bacterium]|jgi:mono/diheme cytochrome c family protein
MSENNQSTSALSRPRIFVIGTAATLVMCGLVVMCVPKKPDVIADAARPQAIAAEETPAGNSSSAETQQAQASAAVVSATASAGEKLYSKYCAGCHGDDGRAQTTMSRMMASKPTNLADGPWKGAREVAAIVEIVKNGKGSMPAYNKEISSESDLQSLAEYVLSLEKRGQN